MLSFAVHTKRCLTTLDVNICYTHSASFSLRVPRKWCWQKSHWYQRRQIFWNQPCWMNSSVTSQRWLQFITSHRAHLWKVVLRQEGSHYLPELNLHQVWSPSVSIVIIIGVVIWEAVWLSGKGFGFQVQCFQIQVLLSPPAGLILFQVVPGSTPWQSLY